MEAFLLLILMLGSALIVAVVCLTLCFLGNLCCNTYIKYQDNKKKLEVRAENSKSKH